MSVKSKVKRCNKEINELKKEKEALLTKLVELDKKSQREKLYENIIKLAITKQIGGLRGGMIINRFEIDKMNNLRLYIENNRFEDAYILMLDKKGGKQC